VNETCIIDPSASVPFAALFAKFQSWASDNNEWTAKAMSSKAFSVELYKTFPELKDRESNGVTRVLGLKLADSNPRPSEDLPF